MSVKDIETSQSRRDLFRRFSNGTATTDTPMPALLEETVADRLLSFGISRRGFLQFSAGMAALMGLPPATMKAMAEGFLSADPAKLTSVLYMSFQECTGCLESLVNLTSLVLPHKPQPPFYDVYPKEGVPFPPPFDPDLSQFRITNVLLTLLSLDYQETLMAAAGKQAEEWRAERINEGGYILVVDGSIPADRNSGFFVSGGQSGVKRFMEAAEKAAAIVAVGTCASFGGIPHATQILDDGTRKPSPTGAVSIYEIMENNHIDKPLVNIPGCPPIAEVIAAVLYYSITNKLPDVDGLLRPTMFYGLTRQLSNGAIVNRTVHSDCLRLDAFRRGLYAKSFEDLQDEDKRLYCLRSLGCKGPRTYNACTTVQWNQGTSYPMKSGHGCIGCAEPNFWDGVYDPPTTPTPDPTTTYPTWGVLTKFTEDPNTVPADPNDPDRKFFAFKGLYDSY